METRLSALASTTLRDWLPTAAALLAALIALVGVPLGHWLQGRRERELWKRDRRLEAYSSLAAASLELGSATDTLGGVQAMEPDVPIEMFMHAHAVWTEAHKAFAPAQYRACLVAGPDLAKCIEKMSAVAHDMTAAAQQAGPTRDGQTGKVVAPGDKGAVARLADLSKQSIDLRNEFLRISRKELGS